MVLEGPCTRDTPCGGRDRGATGASGRGVAATPLLHTQNCGMSRDRSVATPWSATGAGSSVCPTKFKTQIWLPSENLQTMDFANLRWGGWGVWGSEFGCYISRRCDSSTALAFGAFPLALQKLVLRVPYFQEGKISHKIKFSGTMFLGHQGPRHRDIPDKSFIFMQVAFF